MHAKDLSQEWLFVHTLVVTHALFYGIYLYLYHPMYLDDHWHTVHINLVVMLILLLFIIMVMKRKWYFVLLFFVGSGIILKISLVRNLI